MKKYLTKAEEIQLIKRTVIGWYRHSSSCSMYSTTDVLAKLMEGQISKELALIILTTGIHDEEKQQEYLKHRYERTTLTFVQRYKNAFYNREGVSILDYFSNETPYKVLKRQRKRLLQSYKEKGTPVKEEIYTKKSSARINPALIKWINKRLYRDNNMRGWVYLNFKNGKFNNTSYGNLRHWFLCLLDNRDDRRGLKKRLKYTVSRDLDKFVYYTGMEGRLCKIQRYKYEKYKKQGVFDEKSEDRHAKEILPDGMFVKQKSLVDMLYPEWPVEIRERIQQAFEPVKDCKMIIDTNFEKAYDPEYCNHQDTDGDLATNYSCMSERGYEAQEFYGKIHGCKVVRWETKDGRQVGRCIMYEYNGIRHFIRIYGLYDYHRAMINQLRKEMHENDLFGRCKCIPDMRLNTDWDGNESSFYLDGNHYGIAAGNGDSDSDYIVTTNYDDDCKTTDGETIDCLVEHSCTCCRCGDRISIEDAIFIDGEAYCGYDCAAEYGWHECAYCGEWINENNDDFIQTEDGRYCCERHARADGYERCDECGKWCQEDSSDSVLVEGHWYCCESCAEDAGYVRCEDCCEWIPYDDCLKIKDRFGNEYYYCNDDCADRNGWEKLPDGSWKAKEN